MNTDSFIAYITADDIYKDTSEDVETRFDTSNYELDRPSSKGKIKTVIGLMKELAVLRAKIYSYLTD